MRPVGLADEQDNARDDAHEECERRAQAQHRRVRHVTVVRVRRVSAPDSRAHQRPDDGGVAHGDGDERQRADERERDPRPHVHLEVDELRRPAAVAKQLAVGDVVDRTARPEQVRVLRDCGTAHACAQQQRAARPEVVALLHRERDGDEPVARERR